MKMMLALLLSSAAVPNIAFAQSHNGHNMPDMAAPAEKPMTDQADPHAGHKMDVAKPAQDDVPVNHDEMDHEGLPHEAEASQEMQMDSAGDQQMDHNQMGHSKMNRQSKEANPLAGHEMPLDLPVNAPPPSEAFEGPTYAADQYVGADEMAASRAAVAREVSGLPVFWFQADRAEYRMREGKDGYLWDVQGYYGGDLQKFWFKSEGEGSFGEAIESAEVQALYSKAVAPFFDFQTGIRQDLTGPDRTHAVVGIQGLAPYLFEVDAALFLSNKGDLTARIEGELDQKITQRLILQPRAEISLAAQDIPELGVGAGVDAIEVGVRLRYEITREFAPYIGIEQEWKLGGSRGFALAAGEYVPRQRSIDRLRLCRMRPKQKNSKAPAERVVKDIRRATRKQYSAEEKIRIVLEGLRGDDSIAELCRREGIAQGVYYKWSKDFMEAGKKRLAGDTARAANNEEVTELRREGRDLKEVVAELTLENRLLKKSMIGDGESEE